MAELYLIRHGKTYGNTLGRYIGTTDEELCEEGREALKRLKAGRDFAAARPDVVYASPLKRCVQTAEILFPEIPVKLVPDLRECDFGAFENKNYQELSGNAAYQAWIDSGGTLPFPGGESREAFQERCIQSGVKTVRVFTDTDATYTFYEKRGFKLVWEKPYSFGTPGRSLVYEYKL